MNKIPYDKWLPNKATRMDQDDNIINVRLFTETIREIDRIIKLKENQERWQTRSELIRAAVQSFLISYAQLENSKKFGSVKR